MRKCNTLCLRARASGRVRLAVCKTVTLDSRVNGGSSKLARDFTNPQNTGRSCTPFDFFSRELDVNYAHSRVRSVEGARSQFSQNANRRFGFSDSASNGSVTKLD